jgi:hypothetical protein
MLNNLTAYDILNALVPGSLVAFAITSSTVFNLFSDQQAVSLVLLFGYGLVMSRIGSVLMEPIFLKIGIIARPNSYEEFIEAAKTDSRIDRLVEVSNMHRTICASTLTFMGIFVWCYFLEKTNTSFWSLFLAALAVLILFTFSWRKQEMFIVKRINQANKK